MLVSCAGGRGLSDRGSLSCRWLLVVSFKLFPLELFHGEPHASTFSVIVNIKKVFVFTNSSRSPLTSVLQVSSSFGLTSSVSPSVQ